MSWSAYPIQNGTPIEGAPGLHSSTYASAIAQLTGQNMYWQRTDDDQQPDFSVEDCADLLRTIESRSISEPYNHYREYIPRLKEVLSYCVEKRCGLNVSY